MPIVNKTPHPVHIVSVDGKVLATFAVVGTPARCREVRESDGYLTVDSIKIPLVRKRYGEITDLPPAEKNTFYIVSLLVAQVAKAIGRHDVVYPDDVVRDSDGNIVGCRSLARA